MSELTEKAARQRLADMIYRAKLLREAIKGLAGEAEGRGWLFLSQLLEIEAESTGDLVDSLTDTAEAYEKGVEIGLARDT